MKEAVETLQTLFDREIDDLYCLVNELLKILNRMSSVATNAKVVEMLDTYYSQTKYQKKKLDESFKRFLTNEFQRESLIVRRIKEHGMAAMRYRGSSEIRDVVLLFSINMIKHFENTLYGTLLTHAKRLEQEDLIDLFLSMKKKIAEDENLPLQLAKNLLHVAKANSIKEEASILLGILIRTQVREETTLLTQLPEILMEIQFERLKKRIQEYQAIHHTLRKDLDTMSVSTPEMEEIPEWDLMNACISDIKDYMASSSTDALKDIAAILSFQRMQHHTLSLLEFEVLLAEFTGQAEIRKKLFDFLNQEKNSDRSLTDIAEGTFFHAGLDKKVISQNYKFEV